MHPLPLPNEWFSLDSKQFSDLETTIKQWIQGESSLTVKIKELGIAFSVEVLAQTHLALSNRLPTDLLTDDHGLYREVLLKQGNVPLVYAQTIMPTSTISGTERMLAELGNQSLGQVLFQSPQAIRGPIEFAEIAPDSELACYIEHKLGQTLVNPCYIRRSLFQLNHKPLLVCECFLPALFAAD